MDENKKVKLYGTSTCPACRATKQFLEQHKVKFEFIDLMDPKNEKYVKKLDEENIMYIPVVEIGKEKIIGFKPNKLLCKLEIDTTKCDLDDE